MPRRDGKRLLLDGEVSVRTVAALVPECVTPVRDGVDTIDLAGVTAVDSAAVALALAVLREARSSGHPIQFVNVPVAMQELGSLYGVDEFLPVGAVERAGA